MKILYVRVLDKRGIIPVLIAGTMERIPWDKLAPTQQDVFFKMLLSYYYKEVLTVLEELS